MANVLPAVLQTLAGILHDLEGILELGERSLAGRARVRVTVTIELERRIICAPGGGRNRMSASDAL